VVELAILSKCCISRTPLTFVKDPYKYISPKTGRKHKKDQRYFEAELHIPREDALVLAKLMKRAKLIDGFQIGPMRLGVGTLIGFVPA